ncbi:hypothetical protein [Streptomyces sp. NPDC008150]|uniref:hypothetical protein n=1 Tax=Streptomyces sp. NPDC008150 TaxID=3364816 RepID=UPI0036EB9D6A
MESPVAASYDDLQSLPTLFKAATSDPAPARGSVWQAQRALFQAMEIGLVNLEELADEATARLRDGRPRAAERSIGWMVGFGQLWAELAWLVREVAPLDDTPGGHALAVADSPSWRRLAHAERELARELKPLADGPGDFAWKRDVLRYAMLQRVALEHACVGGAPYGYREFVRPDAVAAAVHEKRLPGETVFLQFRAAHQMPELLVRVVNDHLERAVDEIKRGHSDVAADLLARAEPLLEVTARMTDLLVDRMNTAEYHEIREALGLTSGSHSVGLHFDLMRDLYPALAHASAGQPDAVRRAARSIGLHIDRWRLGHVNLPRTNLGGAGAGTRSLTGSPDALRTVAKMREAGRARDPYANDGRPFRATEWESDVPPLAEVERRLLGEIAQQTQERFQDVQARTGRYADPSEFTPPPKRCPARPS